MSHFILDRSGGEGKMIQWRKFQGLALALFAVHSDWTDLHPLEDILLTQFITRMSPVAIVVLMLTSANLRAAEKPNIIYLMLDEWGYFESGHMGHLELLTPNIDQFAGEGMRFTNAYAGAPVCGPTRCVLMTGLHTGHTSMRVNDGFSPIRADEPTLATVLKSSGYATGGFGKWGIGGRGTSGIPEKHGFDEFFGYYDQVHAHTFYPQYLIRNSQEVPLPGNTGETFYEGETHAQLAIFKEAKRFIRHNGDKPFFCYLPWTPPHGLWGIDEDDPSWHHFKEKPWTAGQRTDRDARVYAAFLHMVDRQLGEILGLLRELDIDKNTIVFLCGDNGGQDYFKTPERPHGFFGPNLNPSTGQRFRAGKGSLYEGGLKVPYLVRWPGRVKAGEVSHHLLCFQDVMPTLAELTNTACPRTDGVSFLPSLVGKAEQQTHSYLYWEYGKQRAVRMNQWKAYDGGNVEWELYDLSNDIEEKHDVAGEHPGVLKQLIGYAQEAHEPIRPGKVFDRAVIQKDRRQAPHNR
jgi:arylsulfatase A-like enzyme